MFGLNKTEYDAAKLSWIYNWDWEIMSRWHFTSLPKQTDLIWLVITFSLEYWIFRAGNPDDIKYGLVLHKCKVSGP